MFCVIFVFSRFGDPRVLHVLTHSFPTRRSSDLIMGKASILSALLHLGVIVALVIWLPVLHDPMVDFRSVPVEMVMLPEASTDAPVPEPEEAPEPVVNQAPEQAPEPQPEIAQAPTPTPDRKSTRLNSRH